MLNIDNTVIVDALPDGRIVDVEILYEIGQWEVKDSLRRPEADTLADIALEGGWLTTEWAELPVLAETNKARSCALIRFTEIPGARAWVELSTNCMAAVADGRLYGFFASL